MSIVKQSIYIVLIFIFFSSANAANNEQQIDKVIAGINKAITEAATRFELDELTDVPYEYQLSESVTLTFSLSSYDHDLNLAFSLLNKLEKQREKILAKNERTPEGQMPKQGTEKPEQPKRELTRLEKLRQAETQTQKYIPTSQIMISDYDVISAFKDMRQQRLDIKNRAAETDIHAVVAERQAAELEIVQEKQRNAALQEQAAAWQAEMDRQAVERANAMRQWKKQNGFGSHVRRIFGSVLHAGIGTFTGTLTSALTTDLANDAVEKIFGDNASEASPAD